MNIRKYTNAKGNWCFYITNTPTDRFRVTTNFNDDIVETKRKELELLLPLTKEQVKEWMTSKQATGHSFVSLMQEFIFKGVEDLGWSNSTQNHFKSILDKIRGYSGDIIIEEMDEDWMYDYIHHRNDALNSTVEKEVKSIKEFLRWVNRKYKLNNPIPLMKIKMKNCRPNIIFLDKVELKKLQEVELPEELDKVRDLFLFCCMTGMRFSDALKFNSGNVDGDRIVFTTQKTNDTLTIPLNLTLQALIDKYGGIMPKMDIQPYNRHLKTICRMAGIDTPIKNVHYRGNKRIEETKPKYDMISSHSARKSFVSNSLMVGTPISVVMSMTGHKSFQSLQSYVSTADTSKVEAMKKLEFLFS